MRLLLSEVKFYTYAHIDHSFACNIMNDEMHNKYIIITIYMCTAM